MIMDIGIIIQAKANLSLDEEIFISYNRENSIIINMDDKVTDLHENVLMVTKTDDDGVIVSQTYFDGSDVDYMIVQGVGKEVCSYE